MTQQKKKGLISNDEHKLQIRHIEKDRRKFERMFENTREALLREIIKIFGAPANYSFFFCFKQLIKDNLTSEMLLTLYKGERVEK